MKKSEASLKLEEYARNVPGSYSDFVLVMGLIPQRYGFDEELVAYVESLESPTHDGMMVRYLELKRDARSQ